MEIPTDVIEYEGMNLQFLAAAVTMQDSESGEVKEFTTASLLEEGNETRLEGLLAKVVHPGAGKERKLAYKKNASGKVLATDEAVYSAEHNHSEIDYETVMVYGNIFKEVAADPKAK